MFPKQVGATRTSDAFGPSQFSSTRRYFCGSDSIVPAVADLPRILLCVRLPDHVSLITYQLSILMLNERHFISHSKTHGQQATPLNQVCLSGNHEAGSLASRRQIPVVPTP